MNCVGSARTIGLNLAGALYPETLPTTADVFLRFDYGVVGARAARGILNAGVQEGKRKKGTTEIRTRGLRDKERLGKKGY